MIPRRIRFRRGTSAEWATANPVLADGEPGYDTTLDRVKVGDGTSDWGTLAFISGEAVDLSPYATAADLAAGLSTKAEDGHTHAAVDLTPYATDEDLQVVDGRLAAVEDWDWTDVGAAPAVHTHTTSQVTGLDTALAGKAAFDHNHAGAYSPVGHDHDGTYAFAAHSHDGTYAPLVHDHAGVYATPADVDAAIAAIPPAEGGAGGYPPLYSDGSDGDVVISGTVALTRGMAYENLTIPAGATLNTNLFQVWVRGTLTVDGTLANIGPDFTDYLYSRRISGASNGSAFTNGVNGIGNASGLILGGVGGTGGSGTGGTGGPGGPATTNGPNDGAVGPNGVTGRPNHARSFQTMLTGRRMNVPATTYSGGTSGGSGAGNGTQSGGRGGAGGGLLAVYARRIIGSGVIHCDGSGGSNGIFAGTGGGGGGGGGCLSVWTQEIADTVTVRADGGAGGAGGSGGSPGDSGLPGNFAVIFTD